MRILKQFVVGLSLLSMTAGSVAVPMGYAVAAGPVDAAKSAGKAVLSVPGKVKDGIPKVFTKINSTCERFLTEYIPGFMHKPLKVVGHIVPIIPVFKTLANADKFFFVFIESPLLGLINTPISSALASGLGGLAGKPIHFDGKWLSDTTEVYKSYQLANVPRNGVAIDKGLSDRVKVLLNWWYSFSIYTWMTAGQVLSKAHTTDQKAYAYSLIAYAAIWPVFSQKMGVHVITPILFSKFPNDSTLKKLKDPKVTLKDLETPALQKIKDIEAKRDSLAAELEQKRGDKETKRALSAAKKELDIAQAQLKWIYWFRKDVADGQNVPRMRTAGYWAKKTSASTAAAVAMVTIYFLGRWALAGYKADDDKVLQKVFLAFLKDHDPKEAAALTQQDLDEVVAEVHYNIEQVRTNPEYLMNLNEPQEAAAH